MTHDPFHVPPYRERCSHCDARQAAGYSWYSDGHGAIYCERCMARAVELLKASKAQRRSYEQARTEREYTKSRRETEDLSRQMNAMNAMNDIGALTNYVRREADRHGW